MIQGSQKFFEQVKDQIGEWIHPEVGDEIQSRVGSEVWDQTWNGVVNRIGAQIWNQVRIHVEDQISELVQNQVDMEVQNEVFGQVEDQIEKEIKDETCHQVRALLWTEVYYQIYDYIYDQVRYQIGRRGWNRIGDRIQDQVHEQVQGQVHDRVRDQIEDQIKEQISNCVDQIDKTCEQINDQLSNQIHEQATREVWNQVYYQVCNQITRQGWVQIGDQIQEQVHSQVRNQIGSRIQDQINDQIIKQEIWNRIESQIHDQFWTQIEKQTQEITKEQVENELLFQVLHEFTSQVGDEIYPLGYQFRNRILDETKNIKDLEYFSPGWRDFIFDGDFAAFYDYWTRIGIINHENSDKYIEYLKSYPGYVIFLQRFAFVCGLPREIHRDNEWQLHCETGPALSWEDGYTQYYWHGISIPAKWIDEPLNITSKDFLNEDNAERRRVLHEILGTERLTEILDLEVVDTKEVPFQTWDREAFLWACQNGELGEEMVNFTEDNILIEPEKILPYYDLFIKEEIQVVTLKRTKSKVDGGSRAQFIEVRCPSTGEVFHLGVPEDFTDASKARAWTLYEDETDASKDRDRTLYENEHVGGFET